MDKTDINSNQFQVWIRKIGIEIIVNYLIKVHIKKVLYLEYRVVKELDDIESKICNCM